MSAKIDCSDLILVLFAAWFDLQPKFAAELLR